MIKVRSNILIAIVNRGYSITALLDSAIFTDKIKEICNYNCVKQLHKAVMLATILRCNKTFRSYKFAAGRMAPTEPSRGQSRGNL
jgi:hypothetical protein